MDIYVVSPYTDKDPAVTQQRVREVDAYVAELTKQGKVCYSPVSAAHHLLEEFDIPGSWEYWKMHCETMIVHTYEVHVLCLDGWEESKGVQAEIEFAKMFPKKITYINKVGQK